jgi:putative ABC transport system substrate-binding protein
MRPWTTRLATAAVFLCIAFLTATAGSAADRLPARNQARARLRILILETMPVPVVTEHSRWVVQGLAELGYAQGETADIEILEARGDRGRAVRLLRRAVNHRTPDLVITVATLATQAGRTVLDDTDIPQLFCVVADPVSAGVVDAVGVPTGDNITGRIFAIPHTTQLDFAMTLARQTVQDAGVRIGVVLPDYPSSLSDLAGLRQAAAGRDDVVIASNVFPYRPMPQGLPGMLADARQGVAELEEHVDFWWEVSGPLGEVRKFPAMILEASHKPILFGNQPATVDMGAVMAAYLDSEAGGREIAALARDILHGRDPGTIPVVRPDQIHLALNLATTLELGMVVPSDMLELAGDNIHGRR